MHIVTAIADSFASIRIVDVFIPFVGSYRPFWLGLGTVAFDLLLALIITSLLRERLGYPLWRAVHWAAYAAWPIALLHGLGTGSDTKVRWAVIVNVACLVAVLVAVLVRVGWTQTVSGGRRAVAALASVAGRGGGLRVDGARTHASGMGAQVGDPDQLVGRVRTRTDVEGSIRWRLNPQASRSESTVGGRGTGALVAADAEARVRRTSGMVR